MREKARDLVCAMEPFARLVNTTSGRIPVEQLSLANWHDLAKAYNKANTPDEPREHILSKDCWCNPEIMDPNKEERTGRVKP